MKKSQKCELAQISSQFPSMYVIHTKGFVWNVKFDRVTREMHVLSHNSTKRYYRNKHTYLFRLDDQWSLSSASLW